MICILEIALCVFGVVALARGRMNLGKKVVLGAPARMLGLLAAIQLPLALGVGILYGIQQAQAGKPPALGNDDALTFSLIEGGAVLVVALLVFGIGYAIGIPVEEANRLERRARRRRRYDDEEEDYGYDRDSDYDRGRDRDRDSDSDYDSDRDRDRGRDRDRW